VATNSRFWSSAPGRWLGSSKNILGSVLGAAAIGAQLFFGLGPLWPLVVAASYGVGALVAAAIFALDLVLPGWAAALCVAGALFLLGGVAALIGIRTAKKASPPVPEQTVASLKLDLAAVKR